MTSDHCRVTVQRLFSKFSQIARNVQKTLFDSRPTVAWPPTTVAWQFSDFFQKISLSLETSKNVIWHLPDGRVTTDYCRLTVQRLFSKFFQIASNVQERCLTVGRRSRDLRSLSRDSGYFLPCLFRTAFAYASVCCLSRLSPTCATGENHWSLVMMPAAQCISVASVLLCICAKFCIYCRRVSRIYNSIHTTHRCVLRVYRTVLYRRRVPLGWILIALHIYIYVTERCNIALGAGSARGRACCHAAGCDRRADGDGHRWAADAHAVSTWSLCLPLSVAAATVDLLLLAFITVDESLCRRPGCYLEIYYWFSGSYTRLACIYSSTQPTHRYTWPRARFYRRWTVNLVLGTYFTARNCVYYTVIQYSITVVYKRHCTVANARRDVFITVLRAATDDRIKAANRWSFMISGWVGPVEMRITRIYSIDAGMDWWMLNCGSILIRGKCSGVVTGYYSI